MSSHRHNIKKKGLIKKRRFTKHSKLSIYKNIILFFSSTNYNSITKNVLNGLLYFFLVLVVFPIIAIFMVGTLEKANLDYSNIISIFFAFIINLLIFAKIISLRSNWNTLFFKYPHALSWKYILLNEKSFVPSSTFWTSIGLYILIFDNFEVAVNHPYFWTNSFIAKFVLALTALIILFFFEVVFLYFLSGKKLISRIFKSPTKVKNASFDESINNQLISSDSAKIQFTNSKIVLFMVLILSIFFAKVVSDQIDDYFLGLTSFNLGMSLICTFSAFVLFIYFIISLNIMVFKKFKWKLNTDIKSEILKTFWSFFLFINGIYFTKYLAIAMFYYPVEGNDPASIMLLSNVIMPSGKHPLEDPLFIALGTFMDYVTFGIIFSLLAYLVFFSQTSKEPIMEFMEKAKKIIKMADNDSANFKNPISETIEKIFSKQLRNKKFVKYFSLFYYIYILGIPFVISLLTLYLIVKDSMFGTRAFGTAVNKYQYEFGAYILLTLIIELIIIQAQKHYNYPLSCFISQTTWQKIGKYMFAIHYPLFSSCSVAVFMREVYRVSKEYGNIVAPESIQTLQSLFVSVFVLGYLSISVSPKIEEIFIKTFEMNPCNKIE